MRFRYRGKTANGEETEGLRDAKDKFELSREMRNQGITLVSAELVVEEKGWFNLNFSGRVKMKDKIVFASSLASMISAGLSLARALNVIERQTKAKGFKEIIKTLEEKIKNGESFSAALATFPKVFPPVFVAMTSAGEESGKLPAALQTVGEQMAKSYELRRKVKGAMIYPAIIIVVIIIIAILMMIFLVPNITSLFKEMNVELPLSTRVVIFTSDLISGHPILFFAGLLALVSGFVSLTRSNFGHQLISRAVLRLPLFKVIAKQMNSAMTMRTLSSLLSAGVGMVEAINITGKVVQNPVYQKALTEAAAAISKGEVLSNIFKAKEDIYPVLVGEMAEVGEETGNLTGMLEKGATLYEEEVNQATKNLSTIIEPVLMIIIGIAVGFFAVSMMGPIYSLSNQI
ncbi:MAG: type II secretion system F family protein [Patescibacteria group bacterium]